MPLEFVAREEAVGPYSADILCRDSNEGTQVVVDNQLESTDHDLTSTAGYSNGSRRSIASWQLG